MFFYELSAFTKAGIEEYYLTRFTLFSNHDEPVTTQFGVRGK
jgi:hypothetical protein